MVDLKAIQHKMPAFFEMTPDLVCIAGKDGFFKKVNQAVTNKLGYTEEELLAVPIASFIHPEDKEFTSKERAALLNGKVLVNFENRYVTKPGKTIWLEWTSIYFADDEIVFAIAKDITKRKEIEKEVEKTYEKFRSLATHFKNSIEKDRKYLAVELHEELAQLASVVKMDVDWLRIKLPDLPDIAKARVEHASVITGLLINTIRRINF
jgi:PAS domain S-box-containing protein